MITNFKIENYKAFENLELKKLSKINLIGGKNNVGKTSILEAILSMYDRRSADILLKSLAWRSVPNSINLTC
jgi:AAA15 family ATPase/GTPase